MTELIIIGNGFDLAHGMKTGYSDYIRAMLLDALSDTPKYGKDSPFYIGDKIARLLGRNDKTSAFEIKPNLLSNIDLSILYRDIAKRKKHILSPLISLLIKDFEKKGWVDLEQSYFDTLYKHHQNKSRIKQLNEDMRLLNKSLHFYLKEIEPTHRSLAIEEHIANIKYAEGYRLWKLKTLSEIKLDMLAENLPYPLKIGKFIIKLISSSAKEYIEETEKDIQLLKNESIDIDRELKRLYGQKPVVLNFNYTNTIGLYLKEGVYINIPIHGTLENDDIILGYGDETSEMYKTLENANDNELLKYFKSFYYMQNSRYRDLERIISSDKFRIHLMGHSCGLSDKVLLSHLFNHENLEYIRLYYYEPSEDNNDHFDKCLNISRHFLDKHQMRCKILPLKGPEDTLEYKCLLEEEKYLLGLTKSVALVPFTEQDIENSDRWEALPEDPDE